MYLHNRIVQSLIALQLVTIAKPKAEESNRAFYLLGFSPLCVLSNTIGTVLPKIAFTYIFLPHKEKVLTLEANTVCKYHR